MKQALTEIMLYAAAYFVAMALLTAVWGNV